jgi:CheY-like chemotaxis protein
MEAVLLAGEHEFDMILMDLDMPVMDGLTATVRLRAQEVENRVSKPVPVVAYTSATSTEERQWQQCGMNELLAKPSDVLAMSECLERWCPSKFTATQH